MLLLNALEAEPFRVPLSEAMLLKMAMGIFTIVPGS